MAYIIYTKSFNVHSPDECPYCGIPNANSKFNQPFSKLEAGMIPGQFTSKTWKVLLPACDTCANIFKKSRIGYFAAGFAALVFPLVFAAITIFTDSKNVSTVYAFWGFLMISWAALLIFRIMKLKAFKVVYVGNGEVIFSSTNQKYATAFAKLNNAGIEEKHFLIKFS